MKSCLLCFSVCCFINRHLIVLQALCFCGLSAKLGCFLYLCSFFAGEGDSLNAGVMSDRERTERLSLWKITNTNVPGFLKDVKSTLNHCDNQVKLIWLLFSCPVFFFPLGTVIQLNTDSMVLCEVSCLWGLFFCGHWDPLKGQEYSVYLHSSLLKFRVAGTVEETEKSMLFCPVFYTGEHHNLMYPEKETKCFLDYCHPVVR